MILRGCLAFSASLAALMAGSAPKLALQYFYDRDHEELRLLELRFLSARRGLAVGYLQTVERIRGVLLESSDGGLTWRLQPFREVPRSLFFRDESTGWVVTDGGLWFTEEGGRSWRKIRSQRGLLRVHFLNSQVGFAIGTEKQFLRTADGGKTWSKVPEGESAAASPNLIYSAIAFANPQQGMVSGFAPVARRGVQLPAWMEPEEAAQRRQLPGVLVLLHTNDGGASWQPQIGSVFGRVTDLQLFSNRAGLALVQFDDAFEYPGEVFRIGGAAPGERVFREPDRLMTSVAFDSGGAAWMAGIEPPSKIRGAAIPGPVKLLRAPGPQYTQWQAVPVDYRANANRAAVSIAPDGAVWVVTDTGMILRLPPPAP